MKNIAIINNPNTQQEHKKRIWILLSLLATITTLIIIICLQIPLTYSWYQSKHEFQSLQMQNQSFDSRINTKHTLKKKLLDLKKSYTYLETIINQSKNPIHYIEPLLQASINKISIQSLSVTKNNFELIGIVPSEKELSIVMTTLQSINKFKNTKISNFKRETQGITCTIKGTLVLQKNKS